MNKYKEAQERRAGGPDAAEESELDVLKQIRDQLQPSQTPRAAGNGPIAPSDRDRPALDGSVAVVRAVRP